MYQIEINKTHTQKLRILCFIVFIVFINMTAISSCFAQNNESKTAHYFDKIKNKPLLLTSFLKKFPKGGDLHMHIGGSVYTERLIRYGDEYKYCLNPRTYTEIQPAECLEGVGISFKNITPRTQLYQNILKNWSMYEFVPKNHESSWRHFFNTFKMQPILDSARGEILRDIVENAANQNILYLEIQITEGDTKIQQLASNFSWTNNFNTLVNELEKAGLDNIVNEIILSTKKATKKKDILLHCNSSHPQKACQVVVKYQHDAIREDSPIAVFAELLASFQLASKFSMFVGVNLVGFEGSSIALKDYSLHMRMIKYLHSLYPKVKISLHAGELLPNIVTFSNLQYHVNEAVNIAQANRIGHAVDVSYEKNFPELLEKMAREGILVEVCLSSNQEILGLKLPKGPLPIFLEYAVPVALCTDDEGVLRTDLTEEYSKAVLNYHLSYTTLKRLARNSLSYSFLPGESLWINNDSFIPVGACAKQQLGQMPPSSKCQIYLNNNQKARLQWKLEHDFYKFEKLYNK